MAYGDSRFRVEITENILTSAQESRVFRTIPVKGTLRTVQWYEEGFTASSPGFTPGTCPPSLTEGSATLKTVILKNLGFSVQVDEQKVKESALLRALNLEYPTTTGDLIKEAIGNELAFQISVASAYLVSQLDSTMVKGNSTADPNVFDGIETLVTAANGATFTDASASPFNYDDFSAFALSLGGGATHVFGHPMALAQVYKAALAAGGATPMLVVSDGTVPGLGLGSQIATLGGTLTLVPDRYFTVTTGTGDFTTDLFVLNINDVYRAEFEPITFVEKGSPSGCLVREGFVYTTTALVIQNMARQGRYRAKFAGSPTMALPLM